MTPKLRKWLGQRYSNIFNRQICFHFLMFLMSSPPINSLQLSYTYSSVYENWDASFIEKMKIIQTIKKSNEIEFRQSFRHILA